MSVYHKPTRHTYLFAVSRLDETAFNTTGSHKKSLKQVLESHSIIKGLWDARNDSAGLFRCFGIVIDGVEDIQLLICEATHFQEDRSRPRLDVAIGALCPMSTEVRWRMYDTKASIKRMWKPELGGSFAAFSECPLDPKIIAYYVSDTYFLGELYTLAVRHISEQGLINVKELCWQQLKATRNRSIVLGVVTRRKIPFGFQVDTMTTMRADGSLRVEAFRMKRWRRLTFSWIVKLILRAPLQYLFKSSQQALILCLLADLISP